MGCHRRAFLGICGAGLVDAMAVPFDVPRASGAASGQAQSVAAWRPRVPRPLPGNQRPPLAYLDTAATTLRPRAVIDAVSRFDETDNANPAARCTRWPDGLMTRMRARASVAGSSTPVIPPKWSSPGNDRGDQSRGRGLGRGQPPAR